MTESSPDESVQQHRRAAAQVTSCAVLTVSDTRTLQIDRSGQLIVELLETAGHRVADHSICADEPTLITASVLAASQNDAIDAMLVTGGTGITSRDQTPEAVRGLLTKELPGYGELLRMLSYEEIGTAAMLSRALGGLVDRTLVLTMPGSSGAVRLAMEKLILPELAHMVSMAKS